MSARVTNGGFADVLRNRHFLYMWAAQLLSQLSRNAIHFVQIVLIERLTGSSVHLGLMIFSFTIPGALFSPIAGVLVDHLPRKYILLISNLLRALLVVTYVILLKHLHSTWALLILIYLITFIASTIGQFFAPAEQATLPLLLPKEQLLSANSLFNLTTALSQALGLLLLGPILVKTIGIANAFLVIAVWYGLAALLILPIPRDKGKVRLRDVYTLSRMGWSHFWQQIKEAWKFIARTRIVLFGILNMGLVAMFLMILAMVAPGFAARVLHMQPEDAAFVFAPAGVGMLITTYILGQYGYLMRRDLLLIGGLMSIALAFALLGWVGYGFPWKEYTIYVAMAISFVLGVGLSTVHVVSQTTLQEETPIDVQGRVFSTHYMLINLLGLPPMLFTGALFDLFGIDTVLKWLGIVVTLFMMGYAWVLRRTWTVHHVDGRTR